MQRTIEHFRPRLEQLQVEVDLPPVKQALSASELVPIIDAYDGIIAGDDELNATVLQRAVRMRAISKWGVGVDGIDRLTADRQGIAVTNTPGMFGDEVADVAMGYITMLARGLHLIDRSVRAGNWAQPVGMSLMGKPLGVIGLGSVGGALVQRGRAFGMKILGYEIDAGRRAAARAAGVETGPLDALLSRSRFVTLCCPLTPATHHTIDASALARMRPDAYIVNVARGPLIDEAALEQSLADNTIAGAALDVFETEPLPVRSRLRRLDSVILGSHNASNTAEATMRTSEQAVENLVRALGLT
jgi:D-3-phosphoglycerate dehydrogenase